MSSLCQKEEYEKHAASIIYRSDLARHPLYVGVTIQILALTAGHPGVLMTKTFQTLFVSVAILSLSAMAQDISGTIQGVVLDPSKAAVPNAKVTVTNTARNQEVRSYVTDSGGNYSLPVLPVGTYSLRVEANGFKAQTLTGIVLNVNDNLKINVGLELGTTTDQVNVEASPLAVDLNTAASSTVIEGRQVRELPMATRNYEALVALMPGVTANQTDQIYIGVSSPAGTAFTLPFSINGQRNSANNWTVDGADNVDRGSDLTLLTFPSIEAIEEFKVLRSVYTADSGRAGGGQVTVVTRSGTNQFHGTLYEFARNNAFAANNWENNANRVNVINGVAQVPPLRWNDFGGTIGGPVYIPGHYNTDKNKTFFFYSEEHSRIITYTTFNPTVPTTGMLQGQFTQPVCVAFTGTTCSQPGTSIANINPVAAAYIKDIYSGLPLSATSTSIFSAQRNVYNHDQHFIRVDHSFSTKFSLWGKFINDNIPTIEPGGLFTGSAIPNGATTSTNAPGRGFVVHGLNTIRPNLLNEAGFNFSRGAILSTPIGLTNLVNSPDLAKINLPFPSTLGVAPSLAFTGGSGLSGYGPYNEYNRNYTGFDNLTWIKGRHTVKAGFSVNRYQKTENAAGSNYGAFTFSSNGLPTGTTSFFQAWANFLLGNVATFTQASKDITPNLHAWQTEAYVQDDFRFNPRLTFSYGVRWSYFGPPSDDNQLLTTFDPTRFSPANAPQVNPANGNLVTGTGTNPSLNGIIIGGQNSQFGSTVQGSNYKNFAPRLGIAWDPFGNGKTSIRTGYGIYYDSALFGTYEQNIFANPPYVQSVNYSNVTFQNPTGGTLNVSAAPLVLRGTPTSSLNPYVQQWSFDVQREIPFKAILDVGYFGSKGTHLLGIVDINQAAPGVALAAGLHTGTGTVFTTADDPRINAVRPYLGFNAINVILPAFDSNYHSLQVNLHKDFGSSGLFSLAYTWSKNLTDNASDRSNAPQSSYNWHDAEYGPATLDRRQVLTFNYVYQIPIFKNRKDVLGYVANGWQLSGITSFGTGLPFTVTTSNVDPAGLGLLGSSVSSSRPDMVCDPNATAARNANVGGLWFNTSCFQPVAQGTVRPGNAGRGVVRGPGYAKWDVSLYKNIPIHERAQLQLRLETFNTFNHPNPSGIASLNITSSLFGQINTYRDPRLVQIAGKFTF